MKSIDFHPYEEIPGMDPVFATASLLAKQATNRYKPFIAGANRSDLSARRFGLHYLRLPYISTDVWYARARKLGDVFAQVKDGNDNNFFLRHPELKLLWSGKLLESDEYKQAAYHMHAAAHYTDLSTAMILAYVQAIALGRITGYSFSPKTTSTLKFATINSMLSEVIGMPIDRKRIEYCISQMHILADRDDKSSLQAFPVWMPLQFSHFMDVGPLDQASSPREYLNATTMRHLLLEEYSPASGTRSKLMEENVMTILSDDIVDPADADARGFGYGVASDSTFYSKSFGWWIDHFAEIAAGYTDMLRDRFVYNATAPRLNVVQSQNKVADLWFTLGIVDSRLAQDDLSKWVDMVSKSEVDLQDYAKQNWSGLGTKAAPYLVSSAFGKVITADSEEVGALNVYSPTGLPRFDAIETSDLDKDIYTLIAESRDPAATLAETFPFHRYPYAVIAVAPESTDPVADFLDMRNVNVYGPPEPVVTPTPGYDFYSMDSVIPGFGEKVLRQQIMGACMDDLTSDNVRFVGKSDAGKFLTATLNQEGVYIHERLRNLGLLVPMYVVTPVIDPYDPFQHGIFEVFDTSEKMLPDVTDSEVNFYPPATPAYVLAKMNFGTPLEPDAWLYPMSLKRDIPSGNSVSIDSAANSLRFAQAGTSPACLAYTPARMAGLMMVFTGDLFNQHITAHFLRSDIFRMNMITDLSSDQSVVTDITADSQEVDYVSPENTLMLPVSPLRHNTGIDIYSMPGAMDAAFTGLDIDNDGEVTVDLDTMDGTFKVAADIDALWARLFFSRNYPSVSRQNSEYTEGGCYVYKGPVPTTVNFGKATAPKPSKVGEKIGATKPNRPKFNSDRPDRKTRSFSAKTDDFAPEFKGTAVSTTTEFDPTGAFPAVTSSTVDPAIGFDSGVVKGKNKSKKKR